MRQILVEFGNAKNFSNRVIKFLLFHRVCPTPSQDAKVSREPVCGVSRWLICEAAAP